NVRPLGCTTTMSRRQSIMIIRSRLPISRPDKGDGGRRSGAGCGPPGGRLGRPTGERSPSASPTPAEEPPRGPPFCPLAAPAPPGDVAPTLSVAGVALAGSLERPAGAPPFEPGWPAVAGG